MSTPDASEGAVDPRRSQTEAELLEGRRQAARLEARLGRHPTQPSGAVTAPGGKTGATGPAGTVTGPACPTSSCVAAGPTGGSGSQETIPPEEAKVGQRSEDPIGEKQATRPTTEPKFLQRDDNLNVSSNCDAPGDVSAAQRRCTVRNSPDRMHRQRLRHSISWMTSSVRISATSLG
jgi:hypothetical protein